MNIYIFNWRDIQHPLSGGAELSLWEHAKYWKKKGATIFWFASSFEKAPPTDTIDGIHVIRKGSHFTVHYHAFRYFFRSKFKKTDIIIDSFHFLPFFTPLYIKHVRIFALINETARGIWFKNLSLPFSAVGYIAEPFFFLPYRKIPFITASDSAMQDVCRMGIKKANVTIVHHGFTPPPKSSIRRKEKKPTVLYLSRMTKDKGIEDAIHAVAAAKNQVKDLQFWIGGSAEKDEYAEYLKGLIKKLGMQRYTKMLGFVSEKEKFVLFSKSWLLIHPSIKEGWGLNVIEANACGTPAIAYTVSGLVDSIDNGKTGLLVGKREYRNLAKAVVTITTDHMFREDLSKNAVKWSKSFSWEKAGKTSWHVITGKNKIS